MELEHRATDEVAIDNEMGLLDLALPLAQHVRLLIGVPILIGAIAFGITFLIAPTYTSHTTFVPPQQQQSSAAAALSSLGALSGLAGMAAGVRSSTDEFVSLLQSDSVSDRIIDKFALVKLYDVKFRADARKELSRNVRIIAGKRDGLMTIEVDDEDRRRAADMANQYVEELRALNSHLALSEAQQRREFFGQQLAQTRDRLAAAQQALQGSGITVETLKAEPRSATEAYAKLAAETTGAEVKLQAMRNGLADTAPEVQTQLALLAALRSQLAKSGSNASVGGAPDYVTKYREFKYQETLFDLFSRQYEMARLDEGREGGLIQVVDVAQPAEKKSRPRRALIALLGAVLSFVGLTVFVVTRYNWRRAVAVPANAAKAGLVRRALQNR